MKIATNSLVAFLFLILHTTLNAAIIEGRVVRLSDGDTLTVLDKRNVQHKVRLGGIDAPERHQPFSTQSRKHLSDLTYGKYVTVQWHKRDRYGRIVGKVLVNGADVNLAQLNAGLAWHYKQFENEQSPEDRIAYATAEKTARSARKAIWAEASPTPPWDFRRNRRKN
jgi:endonuclease YncB( thermonuclease family)